MLLGRAQLSLGNPMNVRLIAPATHPGLEAGFGVAAMFFCTALTDQISLFEF